MEMLHPLNSSAEMISDVDHLPSIISELEQGVSRIQNEQSVELLFARNILLTALGQ
jgi:hypothetical protein